MRINMYYTALVAVSLTSGYIVASKYSPLWVAAMIGAGLGYGALSPVLHARRLLFLAGASPHAALAAASIATIAAYKFGVDYSIASLMIGALLIYIAGYMNYRGVDPDVSASILASLSSALGVLALYYAFNMGVSGVSAIIVGDPLLASNEDALIALGFGVLIALVSLVGALEYMYVGLDPEDARLSGARVWFYDLILYTTLAVATVGMIRIVGFILEHVLLLLPGAIAVAVSRGARLSVISGGFIGLSTSLLGLVIGIYVDAPPPAITGLILVLWYSMLWYKR
ncbi:MAG: metal ABC transporter permease [Desulfurococcales archaeon]|nr:metal ABC transporter permease [Desulfurococcales archaeon]